MKLLVRPNQDLPKKVLLKNLFLKEVLLMIYLMLLFFFVVWLDHGNPDLKPYCLYAINYQKISQLFTITL